MGFHTGCWMKVWEIRATEPVTVLRVSISRKNKKTDQFEEDFTGFVRLVGSAADRAAEVQVGDRIKAGFCDVTTRYDKENKKSYTNFSIVEVEELHHSGEGSSSAASAPVAAKETEEDEGELPF